MSIFDNIQSDLKSILPDNPETVKQHIQFLRDQLNNLEQGNISYQEIQDKLPKDNPVFKMIGDGLSTVENNEEAKIFIRQQIQMLESHLNMLQSNK